MSDNKYLHGYLEQAPDKDGDLCVYRGPDEPNSSSNEAGDGGLSAADEKTNEGQITGDPSAKRIVFWEGKITRLSDVDSTTESFHIVFHFHLTWLATRKERESFDASQESGDNEEGWQPDWLPKLKISNAIEVQALEVNDDGFALKSAKSSRALRGWEGDESVAKLLGFDPSKGQFIRAKFVCEADVTSDFDLAAFPFDSQNLTVMLQSNHPAKKLEIMPIPRASKFCTFDSRFTKLDEFDVDLLVIEFGTTSARESRSGRVFPLVSIGCKVSRKWSMQVGNLGMALSLFALALPTFVMDAKDDLGDRLGYSVTLLLAQVASLQFLAGEVPKTSIMTWMDKYNYVSFTYLFAVTGWTGIAGIGTLSKWDLMVAVLFIVLFVLIHVYFLGTAVFFMHSDNQVETMEQRQNNQQSEGGRIMALKFDIQEGATQSIWSTEGEESKEDGPSPPAAKPVNRGRKNSAKGERARDDSPGPSAA